MASSYECVVTNECIFELIDFFATRGTQYRANLTDRKYEVVEKMCLHLLARDYYVQTIDNSDGSLCPHYPSSMIILERDSSELDKKVVNDAKKLRDLFTASRSARCFCRFPVPVILFNKKNVCRSSTLSTAAEMYGRNGLEWMLSAGIQKNSEIDEDLPWERKRNPNEWGLVDQVREYDSQLISVLGVGLICDLMVEMRKAVYGMTVTSSEKADGSHWYSRFNIASIPYPGCEFFCKYRSQSKYANELHYDWSKSLNDATLSIPAPLPESVDISFTDYQSWNVVELTQKYLKLLLHYYNNEESGILVHCVSGWDRTPLYISLIRLSLWADGLIHTSLKPPEILYLTLAYDWFMFGHKFEERLKKSEEVLYFCFDFLKYITSDDYSFNSQSQHVTEVDVTTDMSIDSNPPSTVNGSITHNESVTIPPEYDVNKSLHKVTMDAYHGSCLYNRSLIRDTSPPVTVDTSTTQCTGSVRSQRLLIVRDLFIASYDKALPQTPPTDEGVGSRLYTLFGRVKI